MGERADALFCSYCSPRLRLQLALPLLASLLEILRSHEDLARLGALAGFCERKGDGDSARLLGVEIMTQERRYYEQGKQMLVAAVATEESQARARRAAYRTLELAGEIEWKPENFGIWGPARLPVRW